MATTDPYSQNASTIYPGPISDVATTGSTTTTPYGFATAAQADSIPTTINAIITALERQGIVIKV